MAEPTEAGCIEIPAPLGALSALPLDFTPFTGTMNKHQMYKAVAQRKLIQEGANDSIQVSSPQSLVLSSICVHSWARPWKGTHSAESPHPLPHSQYSIPVLLMAGSQQARRRVQWSYQKGQNPDSLVDQQAPSSRHTSSAKGPQMPRPKAALTVASSCPPLRESS